MEGTDRNMEDKNASLKYKAVVIGVSAGGMNALPIVLCALPSDFPMPVVIVQHISPDRTENYLIEYLNRLAKLQVKEAEEKEFIAAGNIYIAPAGYHLMIENDKTFSLCVDEKIQYSRPSIDVLFESASEVYDSGLIGMILTGANSDGAEGLKKIKENGGLTIVQDQETAEATMMPRSAIEACEVDHVLPLVEIGDFLKKIAVMKEG